MPMEEERKYILDHGESGIADREEDNIDNFHVHVFATQVDVGECHQHMLLGVSGPAKIDGRSHVHQICIRTSFSSENDPGHWHWVDSMTDRAIEMPDGSHIHYFAGRTSKNEGHCHDFSDVTGIGPDVYLEEENKKPCKYKYKRPEEEYN